MGQVRIAVSPHHTLERAATLAAFKVGKPPPGWLYLDSRKEASSTIRMSSQNVRELSVSGLYARGQFSGYFDTDDAPL